MFGNQNGGGGGVSLGCLYQKKEQNRDKTTAHESPGYEWEQSYFRYIC